jgi:hypothetical protein
MVNISKTLGALLAVVLGAVSACGVKDLDFSYANAGGSSNSAGASATGGSAGAAAEVPTSCREGEKRCAGNTPQTCDEDGEWQDGKACSGKNETCTGAGVCAPFRLVNAGIDSLGLRPPEKKIVIKQQTLASSPRLCAKSGVCITGAIR